MLRSNLKMITMKKYIKNIAGILCCIMVISCNDYLDVQPEDKYLEDDVYNSEGGIETVLNGIYINMSDEDTYGGNMTMSTVEILGQQFNTIQSSHEFHDMGLYNYTESTVKSKFEAIWSDMFVNILNLNKFIEKMDGVSGVLSTEKSNILKGEAYALRAMMHFDVLRLFGPIYSNNPEGASIPYYTKAKTEIAPLESATSILTNVLQDLDLAEELLSEDPVREYGSAYIFMGDDDNDWENFYRFRNIRMNYYAVKALQARVNLYAGNTTEALIAAKGVIEEASQFFPWTPPVDIISAGGNPDRVFSSEILFAVQNIELYQRQYDFFDSSLTDYKILAPKESRLSDVFENNFNDYRFNSTWIAPTVGAKTYKTFYKFDDVEDATSNFRFMQPLIRMSEMYYIAAETEIDPLLALNYLNTVRYNRGLGELGSEADIESEILKEYKKEFYGEGQLFFYYKRKNMTSIPSANSGTKNLTMGVDQYMVPLPDSETTYRTN